MSPYPVFEINTTQTMNTNTPLFQIPQHFPTQYSFHIPIINKRKVIWTIKNHRRRIWKMDYNCPVNFPTLIAIMTKTIMNGIDPIPIRNAH